MKFPIFEALMLISFGSAWPFSILKSIRSRTNKGKSLLFLYVVNLGYICGIIHKIYWSLDVVIVFYIANSFMVTIDTILYYRNKKLE